MILRRVIEHVKAQNWTAVALDFVIVVIGVFIGIQVSNWNAARSTRDEARAYLVELREDFRGNLALIDAAERDHVKNITAMMTLLDASAGSAIAADAAALNAQFTRVQSMPTVMPITRTYDNLVGSGDLKIIKSRDLQDALARFSRQVGLATLVQNTHELELVNTFQPYIIANLDYAALGYDRSAGEFALKNVFDEDGILALVDDREFRNIVVQKWTISVDLLEQTRAVRKEAEAILAILDAELQGQVSKEKSE